MSSTEQKNITQPFISCSHVFGIIPSILVTSLSNYKIRTGDPPFEHLGATPSLGRRIRDSQDPITEAKLLLPVLSSARVYTRYSALLLKLTSDSNVYTGNQAICRYTEALCTGRGGIRCRETKAMAHASLHTAKVSSLLSSGSYCTDSRVRTNIRKIGHSSDSKRLRNCSDLCDHLSRGVYNKQYHGKLRSWCSNAKATLGISSQYARKARALEVYQSFNPEDINKLPEPPSLKQKWFTIPKHTRCSIDVYAIQNILIVKIRYPDSSCDRSTLYCPSSPEPSRYSQKTAFKNMRNEVYIFSRRDLQDMAFLLQSCSHIKLYFSRRKFDTHDYLQRSRLLNLQSHMTDLHLSVMRQCGTVWDLRNKLGVYFDVLQWRYLARISGDMFYNHSEIMARKVKSKGIADLPDQNYTLTLLLNEPVDIAIDLLGIYKASIYPEVDPFEVVAQQRDLHYSRFDTDWEPGSEEAERFKMTRAYMWYLGSRVIQQRTGVHPGKIRQGAEPKDWHKGYAVHGIPGSSWRDACDVDLTNTYPVSDISNDQYIRQQDSASAPPNAHQYESFESMRRAPRRHKRKLLYAVQEPNLPDLPEIIEKLNTIGSSLQDGYVGEVAPDFEFSTDIVTGSRCERHKDAPRPFYAACSPWGCILSYFDGITRDFLSGTPQSMLGKSTKQKYTDLSTAARRSIGSVRQFFMSDDKAKYSPRMDPNSQQLPAEFFAEVFGIPGMRAFGPIMYHCELYYRVDGHLVHYNSNGTDREGMRGASNTWLEIVAQGLTTRLSRERKLLRTKSLFLSFIDDGLRRFDVDTRDKKEDEIMRNAQLVIDDVIFGLKVLGRELSWDKTFISTKLFVMLNEVIYDGSHFSSGLKSFCTSGDIEVKEVMTAADYEQLYFGKMRGAMGVGCPLDLAHYAYVFETVRSHYTMGLSLQDNRTCSEFDYRLFCVTPLALGGAGIRSMVQMNCNEVAGATREGIGNLMRLAGDRPWFLGCVHSILSQEKEVISSVDFMREPEQMRVSGPRIKTQRLAAEVRQHLHNIAQNSLSRKYMEMDSEGMKVLDALGRILMSTGDVSAEEVRLLYSSTPVAFIDEFIQKLSSSSTLTELIGRGEIRRIRQLARLDLIQSAKEFRKRSRSDELISLAVEDPDLYMFIPELTR